MVFEGTKLETVVVGGEIYFNPYDVGKCLELSDSSVRTAISKMSNSQTILLKNSDVNKTDIRKLNNAGERFLTESGVYKLAFKSNKPKAEEFSNWVTDEVLPSIRKTGMYATDELLNNPDLAIQAFTALKEEREKNKQLSTTIKVQEQLIGELQPKANYVDIILDNKGLVTITQIAKDYGMSGKEMNQLLHNYKVQYKQSGQWLLYSKHHDKGYTHSRTFHITHKDGTPDTRMETKWTQKGRLFIYELLKDNGILPIIEQKKTA